MIGTCEVCGAVEEMVTLIEAATGKVSLRCYYHINTKEKNKE